MQSYDVLIVGAGTSGCALAARLSEHPGRSVLLIEAGAHFHGLDAYPPELKYGGMFAAGAPGHPNNWNFVATLRPGVDQPLPRGRVAGGSSALNGMIFTRGLPEDSDGWAAEGNAEWSYASVLPFFKKLENDRDLADEFHGNDGPVPISRAERSEWLPAAEAFVASCQEIGFPDDPDMNGPKSIGVGALPLNSRDGIRINTALAYLDDVVSRPNLTVLAETTVRGILLERNRAIGVVVEQGGESREIHAGEVVLCAGAIKSPHLLMTSGIGPPEELRKHRIPVHQESPHVGRNFTDHCTMHLPVRLPGLRRTGLSPRTMPLAQTGLHFTAPDSDQHSDMMLFQSILPLNTAILEGSSLTQRVRMMATALRQTSLRKLIDQARTEWDLTINVIIMRGESRGEVRLASGDPSAAPSLLYHYLEAPEDLRRMREALRLAARLVDGDAYRALRAHRTVPGDDILGTDQLLDDYMRAHVGTSIHTASTCRMGSSAEGSVVDSFCRVHGVSNLRVVDTSIMPTVVRRCPAATAVMIGERAAAFFD